MATCQLNVRVEQALAAQLRSEAKRQHTTPGALVAQALELLLSGATPQAHQPLAADSSALAAQLRREAKRQHTTPGALVAQALELLLSGATPQAHQPLAADSSALAAQLAALAERVERLEQARPASPERAKPSPPERVAPIPRLGDAAPPAGALATAELAEHTGTNKGAWNNWAVKATPGQVRHHPQAGSWRLLGKGPAPGGGPDRWLWEPLVSSPQP
jgi:hypothetical protein